MGYDTVAIVATAQAVPIAVDIELRKGFEYRYHSQKVHFRYSKSTFSIIHDAVPHVPKRSTCQLYQCGAVFLSTVKRRELI